MYLRRETFFRVKRDVTDRVKRSKSKSFAMTMKNPWTGNYADPKFSNERERIRILFFFSSLSVQTPFFFPLEIGDWRTVARSINIRRLIIFTVVNGWITLEEGFP